MIAFIAKLLTALNANSRPGEIAAAIACGCALALIPGGNLLWVVLFILFFLLRLHVATMLVTAALLKPLAHLADPLLHKTGLFILSRSSLQPLFMKASTLPILPFTHFNDTVVMGSLIWSIILWLPLFLLGRLLVKGYRSRLAPKIAGSKMVKAFQKIPLIKKIGSAMKKTSEAWGYFAS
ncbi:TIGR03546 family protein [Sediminispirochaeta bajacaliforniensis]|uniref:TIGR03546 family protein n=1 Tax=Sediminispirochaeta bajacaliforniensis TaxID=148 RepID=UPI00036D9C8B|nr:TIGR03546 family protein [Sediminispirochaeta bajacaliforniensis]